MRSDNPTILDLRTFFMENGFDEDRYLAANKDLSGLREDPLHIYRHLLAHGLAEGRELWIEDLESLLRNLEEHKHLPRDVKVLVSSAVKKLINSRPTRATFVPIDPESSINWITGHHRGYRWLAPADLCVSPVSVRRILIVGSCFAKSWRLHWNNISPCDGDFVLTNNIASLGNPPRSIDDYDFQVVQISLRSIMPDDLFWRLDPADLAVHTDTFNQVRDRLRQQLTSILGWNLRFGILTFVTNFMVPQQNPMGRLFPRYDLRNPAYFIDRLNEALEQMVGAHRNVYILDVDGISASMGRMHMQDDTIEIIAHNALLQYRGPNTERIEPLAAASEHFEIQWRPAFLDALWTNLLAMYRTLRNIDPIKLVVVDLDDTLWMGVSGDRNAGSDVIVEGWPRGIAEALIYLKKRGIILGIISKNDESRVQEVWEEAFSGTVRIDDFAVRKINWRPKVENMHEVLSEVNLLPRNTLFIDDNPVERAAMRHGFPDMRILGKFPYYLRRILLWAPETQVAVISEEASRRTEMIHAQIDRDNQRKLLSEEEFLGSLSLKVKLINIGNLDHPKFSRAFELLNKTNQFNTTGRRWKLEECITLFESGATFRCFEIEDKFTKYGLVGVVIVRDSTIEQWVMSCRVIGFRVEEAIMATIVQEIRNNGGEEVRGRLVRTDSNIACGDLFAKLGFVAVGDEWTLGCEANVRSPAHVTVLTKEVAAISQQ
jgi:FkbH-like protein